MRIEGDVRRSTSPICMSFQRPTQEDRQRVLDRIYKIYRIKNHEY